jgi:hypothetical protein
MSLAYDCIELIRPELTNAVMQWLIKQTFNRDAFATFERGTVRLSSPIAKEVAALTIKVMPLTRYVDVVRTVEKMLSAR